ncbi:synergin gamma-like isoform 2-T2 [Discoglossus pictus]
MEDQSPPPPCTEPTLMDSYITHLKKCLKSIHMVIKKANDILCSISHPSICSEVLLSSQGTDYISGVVEVYRVSKRMEAAITTLSIVSEKLQLILRDIDLSWNNLQAFLSVCPCVLQRLPSPSALDYKVTRPLPVSAQCLNTCCGVCLLERMSEEQSEHTHTHSMLMYEGHLYHPSCANFWLHFVDSTLPTLSCRDNCHLCLNLKQEQV